MKKTKKLFCLFTTAILAVSAFATTMTASAYYDASAFYKESRNYGSEPKIKVGDFSYIFKKNIKYGSTEIDYSATVVEIPNIQKVEIPENVTYDGIEFTVTDLDLYGEYYLTNNEYKKENKFTNVEEIVLPDTIYNITEFGYFPNLKKMNLPKNTLIGRSSYDYLFYDDNDFAYYNSSSYFSNSYFTDCPKLKLSVDINNPYYRYFNNLLLSKDGKLLHMSFNTESNIIIPEGVEKIFNRSNNAFQTANTIQFPSTLKYIDNNVFIVSTLTKVVLPDNIKNILSSTFFGSRIRSVKLSKNLHCIDSEAFMNCDELKSLTIPSKVKWIESSAFRNCNSLKKLKIDSKNINIEKYAFSNCYWLKTVKINSVSTIDMKTFYKCPNLSKVKINNKKHAPDIGEDAFKKTKKGIKFYVKNKKVAKSLKKQLKGSGVKKAKIYVGKTLIYKNVK